MGYQTRAIKYPPRYRIYHGRCDSCEVFVERDYVGKDPGKCPKCSKPLPHCRWCGGHVSKIDKPTKCPTCNRKIRITPK